MLVKDDMFNKPDDELKDDIKKNNQNEQSFVDMENDKYLVFVYGTLRKGFWNHRLLSKSKFIGKAKTKEKYKLTADDIPYLTDDKRICNVIGEVYEVDEQTLESLDHLEGHPIHYQRRQIPVILENGTEITAWCYFYQFDTSRYQLVKTGDFIDYFRMGSEL